MVNISILCAQVYRSIENTFPVSWNIQVGFQSQGMPWLMQKFLHWKELKSWVSVVRNGLTALQEKAGALTNCEQQWVCVIYLHWVGTKTCPIENSPYLKQIFLFLYSPSASFYSKGMREIPCIVALFSLLHVRAKVSLSPAVTTGVASLLFPSQEQPNGL